MGQGLWRHWVAQGASLSPTPQELKHKILLKGKKIGRLEDTLDGPGDEVPGVSDDDNGAEAEEERRRAKVSRLGWGPAGRADPLDTAMSCDDILLHRRQRVQRHHQAGRTAFSGPGYASLCFLWWQCIGGPLLALFLAGRLLIVGMLPPTSTPLWLLLPALALQPLAWVSAGGWCFHQEGPNVALLCRRTRRLWHKNCPIVSSTARMCPSRASRRPAAIPGPLRSPPSLKPRPGSSSGMKVR